MNLPAAARSALGAVGLAVLLCGCAGTGGSAVAGAGATSAVTTPALTTTAITTPTTTDAATTSGTATTAAPPAVAASSAPDPSEAAPSAVPSGITFSGQASFLPVSTTAPAPPSVDPCELLDDPAITAVMPKKSTIGDAQVAYGIYGSGTSCRISSTVPDDEREVTIAVFDGVDPDAVAEGQLARMVDTWPDLGDAAFYSWVDGLYVLSGDTLITVAVDDESGFHSDDEDVFRTVGEAVVAELG